MENMRTLVSGQAGDCKCHWEGCELFRAKPRKQNFLVTDFTIIMYHMIYSKPPLHHRKQNSIHQYQKTRHG